MINNFEKKKISFITTVFNEEENIDKFLTSLISQSKLPNEIIIVDGGSMDNTMYIISNFQFPISKKNVKILKKKGNRSLGRNEAIKNTTGDIILCSDAGCILDRDWVKKITEPFENPEVDAVAGYYKGESKNIFQKCLIPYVLVMPDRIDPENFLPATRSMAFKKGVWKRIGGFPEKFSHNEDYVFARKLKKAGANIVLKKDALVYWIPRKNLTEAFIMFFRFAWGDAEAKIFRPKVGLVFLRYILGILIFFFAIIRGDLFLREILSYAVIFYFLWAIFKNYKYAKDVRAFIILPILQVIADIAVISGTIFGLYKIWVIKKT